MYEIESIFLNHAVVILLSWLHMDYLNFKKESALCIKWGLHCGTPRVHITHRITLSTPSDTI